MRCVTTSRKQQTWDSKGISSSGHTSGTDKMSGMCSITASNPSCTIHHVCGQMCDAHPLSWTTARWWRGNIPTTTGKGRKSYITRTKCRMSTLRGSSATILGCHRQQIPRTIIATTTQFPARQPHQLPFSLLKPIITGRGIQLRTSLFGENRY